jgi:hypothetical protein
VDGDGERKEILKELVTMWKIRYPLSLQKSNIKIPQNKLLNFIQKEAKNIIHIK